MPVRRSADPVNVQYVWDSIKAAISQKQVADTARLVRSIQKLAKCSQVQAELYIKQTLDDGLIVEVRRIAQKGSNVGNEVESYKIKQEDLQTPLDDGYDWYCIECHLAGDVELCKECCRVFHVECSKKASRKPMIFPKLIIDSAPTTPQVSKPATPTPTLDAAPPITPITINEDDEAATPKESRQNGGTNTPNLNESMNESTSVTGTPMANLSTQTTPASEQPTLLDKMDDEPRREVASPTIAPESPKKPDVGDDDDDDDDKSDDDDDDNGYDEQLCSTCNMNKHDPGSGLDLDEFNYLLNFILNRIKSWVPEHLTTCLKGEPKYEWHTPQEMSWRAGQLFYVHMDMSAVDLKIRTKDYKNFSQFQCDVVTMMHNIAIFHGFESEEYGAAMYMMADMDHDISELQNCIDCYKHSNEKFNDKWFCLPCRKPHQLVFAKQKGYPYWPAKVIKEADNNFDVRFFGGKYERAVLPKSSIKPITTSMSQLQIKKTPGFNKAMEQLKMHQSLLANPGEAARIKAIIINKPKAARRSKPRKTESPRGHTNTLRHSHSHSFSVPSPLAKKTGSGPGSGPGSGHGSAHGSDDVYEFHDSPTDLNRTNASTASTASENSTKSEVKHKSTSPGGASGPSGTKRKLSLTFHEQQQLDPLAEHDHDHDSSGDSPESKVRRLSVSPLTPPKTSASPVPSPKLPTPTKAHARGDTDIINISDIDDDKEDKESFSEVHDPTQNLVSSSTELLRDEEQSMQKLDQQYCDAVEKMRRKLELAKTTKQVIVAAMDAMQAEIDRIQNEHNETLKRIFESHNAQVSETKKKQWCFNCEQDAIYHCCWNTAYCSPTCQQQHWQAEHKKVCRRKR